LERVAQRFRRDMWDSVVPEAISESGVEVERFGPVQATAFGDLPEIHLLQQIQGAAEPGAIEGGHLAAAIEWMRAREVDYRIPVAAGRPGAPKAESWLGDRGYERGTGWIKMVRDGSPPDFEIDPGITIYRLGQDEAEGEGLSTIAAEALEMPLVAGTLFFSLPQRNGWHCYTAALSPDEMPVATGSMLIADGVAQLGAGTTLEHARGRGCNAALLHRRLRDAHRAGCHTVFVEVGECDLASWSAVTRNLRRAGFEEAYEGRNWQRPALHPAEVPHRFSG
jgi:GNAT superfamily N-acetyltransferase